MLVVTEYVTKWVDCYTIPNQEATSVAQMFDDYLSRHCTTKVLLTHRGRDFESHLMHEICRRYEIEKRSTSAYHPQANGQTERFNRTLGEMRSRSLAEFDED